MTTYAYMANRQKWKRPQAMLWADQPGTLVNIDPGNPSAGTAYVPPGVETYANFTTLEPNQTIDQFLILSDHNRSDINVSTQRIEKRQRMINGNMRSYHTADKLTLSTSWTNLPSRQAAIRANFDPTTAQMPVDPNIVGYTVDMGAGGAEMLRWYEDHTGPFWVYLSYDKYTNFGLFTESHYHLNRYSQILQMYITSFDYNVVKRSGPSVVGANSYFGYDMWNVNVTLEEV